jgi:glutamine amidotransferase
MKYKIGIVDYSSSNLLSLSKCLDNIEVDYIISKNIKRLNSCDVLILPGVGTFESVMNNLKKNRLDHFIKTFSKNRKKKIIGICIGMQILSKMGNETRDKKFIKGLSIIECIVDKINNSHIGWNKIKTTEIFLERFNNKNFFFNHSYVMKNLKKKQLCIGTSSIGKLVFPSIVKFKNIFGTQFHPEKSHYIGAHILEKIIKYEN